MSISFQFHLLCMYAGVLKEMLVLDNMMYFLLVVMRVYGELDSFSLLLKCVSHGVSVVSPFKRSILCHVLFCDHYFNAWFAFISKNLKNMSKWTSF